MIEQRMYVPVCEALLFEDRVEVRRSVEVDVGEGGLCLYMEDLPALTHPSRLRVQIEARSGSAELVELDLERPKSKRVVSADLQALERALARAEVQLSRRQDELMAVNETFQSYSEHAKMAVWLNHESLKIEEFQELESLYNSALARKLAAVETRDEAQEALDKAQSEQLEKIEKTPQKCVARLRLKTLRAGLVEVCLISVMPCALWRPAHEAMLSQNAVRWSTEGTIWQNTGEDWHNVKLRLSTARPSAGAEIPQLESDHIVLRAKADKHSVKLESRREDVSKDSGEPALQGVYDGGEVRLFEIAGVHDVPSNGMPRRFSIGGFESEAKVALAALPECSNQVTTVATFANRGVGPLLAGPVALYRDGSLVGQSEIPYIEVGEPFELSFGRDDRFAMEMRRTRKIEERMLQKNRTHFVREIDLYNLSEQPAELELRLSMPQSEFQGLTVVRSTEHTTPNCPEADKNGIVHWLLQLAASSQKTVKIGFYFDLARDASLPDPW